MASLNKLIDRKTLGITREIVELLHEAPLPSLDDIRGDIGVIKSFVKDIKAEVKHIESMLPNMPDSRNQQEDDPTGDNTERQPSPFMRKLRDRLADEIERQWRDRANPNAWEGSDLDQLLQKLRGDNLITLSDILSVISLFYFNSLWPQKLDLIEPKELQQAGIQFISRDTSRLINDANGVIMELIELSTTLVATQLNEVQDTLTAQTNQVGDLRSLLEGYHAADSSWFATIYDKLLDCCVVDDMRTVLSMLSDQSDTLRIIKATLAAGGSPAQLGQLGAITAGIKSIQAELSELRRLL